MKARERNYTVVFAIIASDGDFVGGNVITVKTRDPLQAREHVRNTVEGSSVIAVFEGWPRTVWKRS